MFLKKSKLRLIGACVALAALTMTAVSCTGFFVNPTLTGVSVGPQSLSLTVSQTWQMSATGTYSDGSQKALSSGVTWSSSDSTTVSVGQTSGIVTGVQIGQATISAAAGSCSACTGSTTVTVVLTGVTSIVVTPSSNTVQVGSTAYFSAKANGTTDVTDTATWTVVDSSGTDQTANFSVSFVSGQGMGFSPSSSVTPGTFTVQATYNGVVGKATLTVS